MAASGLKVSSPCGVRCLQTKHERQNEDAELDVGLWSMLDDHLLEKIIARLPFKSLFRAQSLSKAWRLRFSNESFQREVIQSSAGAGAGWESYAPLCVHCNRELVGYGSISKKWWRLPSHSYVQEDVVMDSALWGGTTKKRRGRDKNHPDWTLRGGDGSLLFWTCSAPLELRSVGCNAPRRILVTNPLAKGFKLLPLCPDMQYPEIFQAVWEGNQAYKLVLGKIEIKRYRVFLCMQIYDSKEGSWIAETHDTGRRTCSQEWDSSDIIPEDVVYHKLAMGGEAVKDGLLYMLVYTMAARSEYSLISFDVKQRIWKEIRHLYVKFHEDQEEPPELMKLHRIHFSKLFLCRSDLFLVVIHTGSYVDWSRMQTRTRITASVFRLDVKLGLAVDVSRAPREVVGHPTLGVCHGDCIYMGDSSSSSRFGAYNVETREWHCVDSPSDILPSLSGSEQFCGLCLSDCSWDWHPFLWRFVAGIYKPAFNPVLEV